MKLQFKTIGIVGYKKYFKFFDIFKLVYTWLISNKYNIIVDKNITNDLKLKNLITGTLIEIANLTDLIIVIGGDGSMISAARFFSNYNIKIIGINCGKLGFLTDLDFNNVLQQLSYVLNGFYIEEKRFLLEVKIINSNRNFFKNIVINEIVLHSGEIADMIDFEVYINEKFAFSQRSDGLIVATPTGSTAYSLSAGGPILTPDLEAIVLLPMFPHTLSSRPLIINNDSVIRLKFLSSKINYKISCDTQITLSVRDEEEVVIKRSNKFFNLIHPLEYDYFNTLNTKLGWSRKNF
ncbi:NAD(+) kinase [Candidatus Providencia siddallii]|uniref:NAD(+) kinase n=1 Tax=Candidatus Providencia siddallii TaxID=1715285 RepID=UPI00312C7A63